MTPMPPRPVSSARRASLRHSTHKASLIYQQQVSARDIAVADALSALRAERIAVASANVTDDQADKASASA
jgi:hypothetical protein